MNQEFLNWAKKNLNYTGVDAFEAGKQSRQAEIDANELKLIKLSEAIYACGDLREYSDEELLGFYKVLKGILEGKAMHVDEQIKMLESGDYVLVPKEPTQKMLNAAHCYMNPVKGSDVHPETNRKRKEMYKAMINACLKEMAKG